MFKVQVIGLYLVTVRLSLMEGHKVGEPQVLCSPWGNWQIKLDNIYGNASGTALIHFLHPVCILFAFGPN